MELPSAALTDPPASLRQTRPVLSPGPASLLNGPGSCLSLRLNRHRGHQVRGAQVPRTRVCLIPASGRERLCQGTVEPGGSAQWPRVLTAPKSSHGPLCCVTSSPGELPESERASSAPAPRVSPRASPGVPAPAPASPGTGNARHLRKSLPLNPESPAPPQRSSVWNLKHLLKLMTKNVRCVHS